MRSDEEVKGMDTNKTEERDWVGPELPSFGGFVIGTVLFMTGGMLMLTVIGTPVGILLFAAGLGMLLTPKERDR
jgi:hypothetical protein